MKLQATESSYRENSGMSALEITVNDGSWDELIGVLESKPRVFFNITTDSFVGTDDNGETRVPGIATIQKTLDAEAWYRGRVLGYQAVEGDNDSFNVCLRTNVTKIPKRLIKLGLTNADLGKYVKQEDNQ